MAKSKSKQKLTPKQKALESEYNKQRRRIERFMKSAKERGWHFLTWEVLPDKPKKITPASVSRLEKITPEKMYRIGTFIDPLTGRSGKGLYGRDVERELSALKGLETRFNKNPKQFSPKTQNKIARQIESRNREAERWADAKRKAEQSRREREREEAYEEGKKRREEREQKEQAHIKTTDDLIIEGRYVIDQNTGEVIIQLPAEYFIDNGNIYTELYNTRERPFFNPEEYGYQNTGNFYSINGVEQKPVPITDEEEFTGGTNGNVPDNDEWEWEGVTTEEPLYETQEVLEEVERMIDDFDPESAADETYRGISKSAKRRRNSSVDNYQNNKETAQRILDDAINSEGRDNVAKRLQNNAGAAIEATNALLYSYNDDYFDCLSEFATIIKGKALTPEEAINMEGEDTGLSSFFPNPHRRTPNNAGNSRR